MVCGKALRKLIDPEKNKLNMLIGFRDFLRWLSQMLEFKQTSFDEFPGSKLYTMKS